MMTTRDVDLTQILPPVIANDPAGNAMAQVLNLHLREAAKAVDLVAVIARINPPENSPLTPLTSAELDELAWQLHVDYYEADWPIERKRAAVANSIIIHAHNGTPAAVEALGSIAFSAATDVKEWWEPGESGVPYHYRIETDGIISDEISLKKYVKAVRSVQNIRSRLDGIRMNQRAPMPITMVTAAVPIMLIEINCDGTAMTCAERDALGYTCAQWDALGLTCKQLDGLYDNEA